MKVYVDELPKSCNTCPCRDDTYCNLYWETKNECLSVWDAIFNKERDEHCPLQSLADYTKQVRKEVCEEIRVKSEDCYGEECYEGYKAIAWIISEEKLKQIQGAEDE